MAKGLKVGESYWSLIFGARAIIADRLSVPIYHICIQPLHICQSTQLLLISSGSRETVHPDIPLPVILYYYLYFPALPKLSLVEQEENFFIYFPQACSWTTRHNRIYPQESPQLYG